MDIKIHPWFMLYVIYTCFYFRSQFSLAAGRISINQSLSGDQTISSDGGAFTLGFFKPGSTSNYYIGIWYNTVSEQTIAWVANREKPVLDKYSSQLTIYNGDLVLLNESGFVIWSTNLNPTTSSSVEAVLLDEGNLVLRDESNSSEPLWQSCYYPTDTWLPGCTIGLDKTSGRNTSLTSWKNREDPAPGVFSLELDPNGTSQFFIMRNKSLIMWTSGAWNGQTFSLIPEMSLNYLYSFSYIENPKEQYFTYASSIMSRFQIDVEGQLQQQTWLNISRTWSLLWYQPRDQCQIYGFCGTFGICNVKSKPFCHCLEGFHPKSENEWNSEAFSAGCARKTSLHCANSSFINGKSTDKFLASQSMVLPAIANLREVTVGSAHECESTCLNNCSCSAYAYYDSNCSIWSGDLSNLRQVERGDPNGKILYVRLAASEFSSSKNNKGILIGVVVGSAFILFLLGLVLSVILRRKKMRKIDEVPRSMPEINKSIAAAGGTNNSQLVLYTLKSILTTTNNFSEANKLGEGGFGPVYKGHVGGDQDIAIKRLSRKSGQGLEEFMNELKLIAKLQHQYLVRLLGYCVEKEENILIYEYMPNRSLDKYLFDPSVKTNLVWDQRFKIAEGVAQGLLYIHKFSRLKVIHRDLKASNILLDETMSPKISDFGMARIFGMNQIEANTNRVVGTYGYMSPEYAFYGRYSEKSDVFSFGVLLLEIVSGTKNTSFHRSGLSLTLLSWAWELQRNGKEVELIDPSITDACRPEEAVKCIHVGLLCVQDDPIDRPTMSSVVLMLSSDTQTLPSPKEPAFHPRRPVDCSQRRNEYSKYSNNELTVSWSQGR